MSKLDSTIDEVTNTRFGNLYHDIIREAVQTTQFTEVEAKSILMVYYKFVLANGTKAKAMSKKQFFHLFLVLFKIHDLHMIERTLLFLAPDSKNEVDAVAWVKLFSVFMSTDLEVKAKFTFQIYNKHNTGFLNRENISQAIENFFKGDDEDEVQELRADMVEMLFKKFDVDRDGLISYEDYSSVVFKQPLLMEFLGQCVPGTNGMTMIAHCTNIMSFLLSQKN